MYGHSRSTLDNAHIFTLKYFNIFSRYIWLRPLSSKSSKGIAKTLQIINQEHEPPNVLQSDQGGEFKGVVKRLGKRMNIKVIYSSPYHPQSQGKVELRYKMMYDFLKMGHKGVNWVKQLPEYERILNDDPKEVLSYISPFAVYYGRERNCTSVNNVQNIERSNLSSNQSIY